MAAITFFITLSFNSDNTLLQFSCAQLAENHKSLFPLETVSSEYNALIGNLLNHKINLPQCKYLGFKEYLEILPHRK